MPIFGGNGKVPPADIYKAAVEEYRFQAQFNWSRTQYLLAFNLAVITAASVVASKPGRSATLIFAMGVVACVLTIGVVKTQHEYYRAARNRMKRIEADYAVKEEEKVDSTATAGRRPRKVSVNQLVYFLLVVMAIANVVGAVIVGMRT